MNDFKIGDRVLEIATGDTGIIKEKRDNGGYPGYSAGWWVDWKTGEDKGHCLHVSESAISVIERIADELFTKEQLAYLDERYGFKKD